MTRFLALNISETQVRLVILALIFSLLGSPLFTLAFDVTPINKTNVKSNVNTHFPLQHWRITQRKSGFSYNTANQFMTSKGIMEKGLVAMAKRGNFLLKSYWQEGAYRSTIIFNHKEIVNGFDVNDVSRITSFRFDKRGNFAFIHTTKGPKSKVRLIYNHKVFFSWPRLSKIKIIYLNQTELIISQYIEKQQKTLFSRYQLNLNKQTLDKKALLASIDNCAILSAKVQTKGILLQTYCSTTQGSDINFLDFASKKIYPISIDEQDAFFAYWLWKQQVKKSTNKQSGEKRTGYPILTVSGTDDALRLYHAISASILNLLGEPMSLASDEAGKQSWSQSYRTLALAELYHKTGHSLFATIAHQAMQATLRQQNKFLQIKAPHNPQCAWASRIYSNDGKTPLSLLINQAMIANSLINSCNKIAPYCSVPLRQQIQQNAMCLINEYEYLFDKKQGLYQIPYGSDFRYDGLNAPWNWQLTWAAVLISVAKKENNQGLADRANSIIKQFLASWEYTVESKSRALWRYWTPDYYQGWQAKEQKSKHRPKQKPIVLSQHRYEDLNHAGISLLGLFFANYPLSQKQQVAISNTIEKLINLGSILPREMDGNGPVSSRWSIGAGWHVFAPTDLSLLFTHKLPGAVSSNKHLAYALLTDAKKPFYLQMTLSICPEIAPSSNANNSAKCRPVSTWSWQNVLHFLKENPLFTFEKL